jgi:hypothetical protein
MNDESASCPQLSHIVRPFKSGAAVARTTLSNLATEEPSAAPEVARTSRRNNKTEVPSAAPEVAPSEERCTNLHAPQAPDPLPHALARVAEIHGGWRDQGRQGIVPRSFG